MNKLLLKGTAIVSSLTIISRVLGFIREVIVARLLGASLYADAFFVAFRIPNLLRSVFGEGALNSAFVPVISELNSKSHSDANEFLKSIASWLILGTGLSAGLGILYAEPIIRLIAPGFEGERLEICVTLTQIMFPYIIFVSLIALINGALNSVSVFGISAFAQIVMNIVMIAGAFLALNYGLIEATNILAWSVLVGGIVQVVVQLGKLQHAGFSLMPSFNFNAPGVSKFFKLFLGALLGAAIYQVSIFVGTQLASFLPEGNIASLSYADRLVQLPIGVFSLALSSVLLPVLSQSFASHDKEKFNQTFLEALRWSSLLLLPLTGWLMVHSLEVVSFLFEGGAFTKANSILTANALGAYALGIWGVTIQSLGVRALNASHRTLLPAGLGFFTLIVMVYSSLYFMGPIAPVGPLSSFFASIQPDSPYALGASGIAYGSSLAFTASGLITVGYAWVLLDTPLGKFFYTLGNGALAALFGAFLAVSVRAPHLSEFTQISISSCLYLAGVLMILIPAEKHHLLEFLKSRRKSS
jgi:putative peptidoglycan lipid II flippase